MVLIDNILMYSSSLIEHEHLIEVLQTLRKNKLYFKLNKCEFWLKKIIFLGHVMLEKGIYMGSKKLEIVLKWKKPTYVTIIHCFPGLGGYYKRFIKIFSTIASPMTQLIRKKS